MQCANHGWIGLSGESEDGSFDERDALIVVQGWCADNLVDNGCDEAVLGDRPDLPGKKSGGCVVITFMRAVPEDGCGENCFRGKSRAVSACFSVGANHGNSAEAVRIAELHRAISDSVGRAAAESESDNIAGRGIGNGSGAVELARGDRFDTK